MSLQFEQPHGSVTFAVGFSYFMSHICKYFCCAYVKLLKLCAYCIRFADIAWGGISLPCLRPLCHLETRDFLFFHVHGWSDERNCIGTSLIIHDTSSFFSGYMDGSMNETQSPPAFPCEIMFFIDILEGYMSQVCMELAIIGDMIACSTINSFLLYNNLITCWRHDCLLYR